MSSKGRSKISYDQLAKAIDIYAGLKFGGSHCELADNMGIARSTVSRLRNMREDTYITKKLAKQFKEVLDYCKVVPHQVFAFGYSINGEEFEAEIVFNTQLGKSTTRYFADGKPVKNVKKWDQLMEAAKGKILFGPYSDHGFYEIEDAMKIEDDPDPEEDDATGLNLEGVGELPLAEVLGRLTAEHNGEPTEADMDELTRAIIDRGENDA